MLLKLKQLLISDNTDETKRLNLNLASISTATTRTLTVRDLDGTVALLSDLVNSDVTLAPVTSILNTPPISPVSGDRYLIGTSPTGVWVGNANSVVQWDGSIWVYTVPVSGNTVFITTTAQTYKFNGSSWILGLASPIIQNGNIFGAKMYIGTNDNFSVNVKVNGNNDLFEFDSLGKLFVQSTSGGYASAGLYNKSSSTAMISGGSSLTTINGGQTNTSTLNFRVNSVQFLQLVNSATATSRRTNFINPTGAIVFASFHNGLEKIGFGISTTAPTSKVDIASSTDDNTSSSLSLLNSSLLALLRMYGDGNLAIGGSGTVHSSTTRTTMTSSTNDLNSIILMLKSSTTSRFLFRSDGKMGINLTTLSAILSMKALTSNDTDSLIYGEDLAGAKLFEIRNDGAYTFKGGTISAQSTGWSVTNPVTLKTFDVTTGNILDVKKVLGTLIDTLKLHGIILG